MSLPGRAPAPLTVVPERGFRRPGCDERCTVLRAVIPGVFGRSELLLHDPDAHEAFGRWQDTVTDSRAHTVVAGTLAVNLSSLDVSVDGQSVDLTATELRLMVLLARRIGQAVSYPEIMREVWNEATDTHHLISVNVSRTRRKLGAAAGLIATVRHVGLRLENLPAGAEAPPLRHVRALPGHWSAHSDACLHCGTTTEKHWAHGICATRACRLAYGRRGWRPGAIS